MTKKTNCHSERSEESKKDVAHLKGGFLFSRE
jgi:hypothetical protein